MYEKTKEDLLNWIRVWFAENGPESTAIIGISGGKDSTIVASLCKEALGADRVLGVLMPNGTQNDISDSYEVVNALGIPYREINIGAAYDALSDTIKASAGIIMDHQAATNLPPRIRMATLYAVAQGIDEKSGKPINGRVANTCNLSETMTGWETRWGDQVGDFSPLGKLTKTEVVEIGKLCNDIPARLVTKAPSDGLTGKTDEDNLGTTYEMIDRFIRDINKNTIPAHDRSIIEEKMKASEYKRKSIMLPTFAPDANL